MKIQHQLHWLLAAIFAFACLPLQAQVPIVSSSSFLTQNGIVDTYTLPGFQTNEVVP